MTNDWIQKSLTLAKVTVGLFVVLALIWRGNTYSEAVATWDVVGQFMCCVTAFCVLFTVAAMYGGTRESLEETQTELD